MDIFYREKISKNDFAPSDKFSCYAPGDISKLVWFFAYV